LVKSKCKIEVLFGLLHVKERLWVKVNQMHNSVEWLQKCPPTFAT